jgi:hypothetical protein
MFDIRGLNCYYGAMTAVLDASRSASARAVRIAHLEELVRLRNTLDAEITAELRAFAQDEVDARIEEVLDDPERVEASIVAQLGLALRISPARARARLGPTAGGSGPAHRTRSSTRGLRGRGAR